MYNSHIHIFTNDDVPKKFLPLNLVRILSNKFIGDSIAKILNNLNPFSDSDMFERYSKFLKTSNKTQKQIFEDIKKYYPENTKFIVLPMDMNYMSAGDTKRTYIAQLLELEEVKNLYTEQLLPFICVDPRRPQIKELVEMFINKGFKGIKIYPSLGYFPYDERLYPIYKFCEKNNIPIIAHCSPYNSVHFRGSKSELNQLLSKSKLPITGKTNKELCANFNNPKNWEYVLKDFPNLNICCAHFGSEYYWKKYYDEPLDKDNWFNIIRDMLKKYPNFYTDVSYTLNDKEFFPLFKILLENPELNNKILFGSDYYMVKVESEEKRFCLDLRSFIGEEKFKMIAETNILKFLNIK